MQLYKLKNVNKWTNQTANEEMHSKREQRYIFDCGKESTKQTELKTLWETISIIQLDCNWI